MYVVYLCIFIALKHKIWVKRNNDVFNASNDNILLSNRFNDSSLLFSFGYLYNARTEYEFIYSVVNRQNEMNKCKIWTKKSCN